MAYWQPSGEEGGFRGENGVKWARGKGVFIGPEGSEHPVLRAYVWYYSTVVQRFSHTSRYYPVGIPKSSVQPVLLAYVHCAIHRVQLYYLQSVHPVGDHCTSALHKIAYIWHFSVRMH